MLDARKKQHEKFDACDLLSLITVGDGMDCLKPRDLEW